MNEAMKRVTSRTITLVVVLAIIIGGLVWYLSRSSGYTVKLIFPAATNLNTGGLVEEQGFTVGHVKHLSVNTQGQAVVEISVSGKYAPLHGGTTAAINYKSLLGERYVEITPGKAQAEIPKGGIIANNDKDHDTVDPRVEIQTILNTLDPTTRNQLASLVPQMQEIFQGQNTQNTQATLQAAAPTITALAQVLKAVGGDGQTLHQLVTQMADLSSRLVNKQSSLVSTVSGLDQSMDAVATETGNLQTGINQLPATLQAANTTLALVPGTVQAAVPLLNDLQTATTELPQFSTELKPVLDVLSPVSQQLVPTLNGLSYLLQHTPQLANTANTVVPQVTGILNEATAPGHNALGQLRPYTADLVGILTNWGNWLSQYNGGGHFVAVPPTAGATSLDLGAISSLPGLNALNTVAGITGVQTNADRQPGTLPRTSTASSTQSQTDAAGNAIQ